MEKKNYKWRKLLHKYVKYLSSRKSLKDLKGLFDGIFMGFWDINGIPSGKRLHNYGLNHHFW